MSTPTLERAEQLIPARWLPLWSSFRLYLEASNAQPNTVTTYGHGIAAFARWLEQKHGRVPALDAVLPEDALEWMKYLSQHNKSWTALGRFSNNRKFFKWLEEEGEIEVNPWARVPAPKKGKSDDAPPPIYTEENISRLFSVVEGRKDFLSRRDTALIRFLLDTGARRGEAATMCVSDIDRKSETAVIGDRKDGVDAGKTGVRLVGLGKKTMLALDRYLRVRESVLETDEPWLWVSRYGRRMTGDAIHQMLDRRAEEAGVDQRSFPHLFRHTAAHTWLSAEGGEGDLMRLMGWKSRQMLDRYGAAGAQLRAVEAHKRIKIGDRF